MNTYDLHCKTSVAIWNGDYSFGPGVAYLLTGIDRYGSLKKLQKRCICPIQRRGPSLRMPNQYGAFLYCIVTSAVCMAVRRRLRQQEGRSYKI